MMMEELPVAVYWIGQDEKLKYCNSNAKKRLEGRENLEDIFLNYEHIPIKKALQGTPTHRREITWITQDRTYEDITTVMPVKVGSEVESALVMSMSIEDLKRPLPMQLVTAPATACTAWLAKRASSLPCSIRLRALPAATTIFFCRANRVPASSVWHTAFIRPARAQPHR